MGGTFAVTIDFKSNKQDVDAAWGRLQETAAQTLKTSVDKEVRTLASMGVDHIMRSLKTMSLAGDARFNEGTEEVGYFDHPSFKRARINTSTTPKEQEAFYAAP